LVAADEWFQLTDTFKDDTPIEVIKTAVGDSTEKVQSNSPCSSEIGKESKEYRYKFMPEVCQICMDQIEADKLFFENKKIFVTHIEDDGIVEEVNNAPQQSSRSRAAANFTDDECQIVGSVSKKARIDEDFSIKKSEFSEASGKTKLDPEYVLPNRRSKRARKNKADIEVTASSFSTIKQVKQQVKFTNIYIIFA
jgi:hypothetical protein